jgi:hypothetical protein
VGKQHAARGIEQLLGDPRLSLVHDQAGGAELALAQGLGQGG